MDMQEPDRPPLIDDKKGGNFICTHNRQCIPGNGFGRYGARGFGHQCVGWCRVIAVTKMAANIAVRENASQFAIIINKPNAPKSTLAEGRDGVTHRRRLRTKWQLAPRIGVHKIFYPAQSLSKQAPRMEATKLSRGQALIL